VDYRQSHQKHWFLQKERRCDNLGCAANKNQYFLNLEN